MMLAFTVLTVLVVSAICSGTEAALFSVSKVQSLACRKYGAEALRELLEDLTRPVAAIVILNNIANIVGSVLIGALAADAFGSKWLGAFSAGLTLAIIVFSEIIPKTLGETHSLTVGRLMAPSVQMLVKVLGPMIWLVATITRPITKGRSTLTTNEAEITLLTQIAKSEGVIEADESAMIQRVFMLNDLTAKELMTHRTMMTVVQDADLKNKGLIQAVLNSQHTRMVVVGANRDDVLGVIRRDSLLALMYQNEIGKNKNIKVINHADEFASVPECMKADALLIHFQTSRNHLAIVVDEYGGVSGVVTLEDVLEVLTGEIVDETDKVVNLQAEALRRRTA
jgi:CBS domain containing-hemolysin-like protein